MLQVFKYFDGEVGVTRHMRVAFISVFCLVKGMGISEEDLAYLMGKVIGDGHMDQNFTIKIIGQIEELEEIKKYFKNIINSRFRIYEKKGYGTTYYMNFPSILGKKLFSLGAPRGKKTEQEFLVPKWILIGNKEIKKNFLQAILEDELTTIKIEKSRYSVKPQFKMSKNPKYIENHKNFISQIRDLLISFEIECGQLSSPKKKEGQVTNDIYFCIQRNKKNIINFSKRIGFRFNMMKVRELEKCAEILAQSLNKPKSKAL